MRHIEITYSTSRGPGGQRRDKKKTGVKLLHLPSGIVVRVDGFTSQARNRKIAFQILRKRLKKIYQPKKKRIPSRMPRAAKEKRLRRKKYHSQKKVLRRNPFEP